MPTVFVPPLMQKLTDGKPTVPVQGKSVREVIDNLDHAYPGVKARLVDGFKLKPNISVAVDGEVSPIGMLQRVQEDSEVHFLPAIGGGKPDEAAREKFPDAHSCTAGQASSLLAKNTV